MQDDPNLISQNTNPATQSSVSNPNREASPFYSESPKPQENYMEVSEKEPQIAPEVENAGVYKVSDKLKLDEDAKNAGLSEAKDQVPVNVNGTKVVLPMTPAQAKIDAKGKPENSITWLANEVILAIKRLGDKNA